MISDGSFDPAQLLRALKVLAFSQCSSGATTACRQSFEKAFRADPNFELLPAERGHPVWGHNSTAPVGPCLAAEDEAQPSCV